MQSGSLSWKAEIMGRFASKLSLLVVVLLSSVAEARANVLYDMQTNASFGGPTYYWGAAILGARGIPGTTALQSWASSPFRGRF